MSRFFDERLACLEAYVPGEQPAPGQFIKLNTNEFPYAPANCVNEAAALAVKNMNLYSDLKCTKLCESFERVFGYGSENVIFTNGSDEALYLCFLSFCGKNVGAAFPDITYGFYEVYADLCGIEKKIIPLENDFSINPADYYSVGKTIFIANPNAPTGKLLSVSDIEKIAVNNPNNIVVIDEAYADFSGVTCSSLIENHENVIVVGTFSKSRGMAGARLGYIIASKELIDDIQKVKFSINPYNVNNITQAVGTAVLDNDSYYKSRVQDICNTRDEFIKRLDSIGFLTIPSRANFVFVKHNTFKGVEIANELRRRGILIRRFNKEKINDYLRITIGTFEQMELVFTALQEIVGGK